MFRRKINVGLGRAYAQVVACLIPINNETYPLISHHASDLTKVLWSPCQPSLSTCCASTESSSVTSHDSGPELPVNFASVWSW